MAKVEHRKLSAKQRKFLKKELHQGLLKLPRREDIIDLLADMLTDSEEIMVARRLQIAKLLVVGASHHAIRKQLGAGFSTIRSTEAWLERRFPEYRTIITPLIDESRKGSYQRKVPVDPHSFKALRKKYPMHFLLFNILLGD